MTPLSPTLRKAAVLVSALDDRTADALLDQMGPQQAAKVRSALVALDDISTAEQQAVLTEFLRQQSGSAPADVDDDVSLELNDAAQPSTGIPEKLDEPRDPQPLAFLHDTSPHHLA